MDQSLIEQMERDARLAEEEADGKDLQQLGQEALDLEALKASHEAEVERLNKQLERLMRYSIPAALRAAGTSGYDFHHAGGVARITTDIKVVGSLSNAEDKQAAIEYLEENGLLGVFKTKIDVEFGKDDEEQARRIYELLRNNTNNPVELDKTIHPMTLIAFVRHKLKEDPTFDFEKVGCVAMTKAKFTKRT